MHRLIPYPAQIPLDTDILNVERWAVQGLGQLAGATHGFGVTAASGLVVTPGSGLSVTVAPGAVLQTLATDATAYGSLAADADLIVQQWLLDTATTVTVPGTATTYYVYVTQVTADDTPVVLPYYNASNPSQTYAGVGNGGATQPTRRAKTLTVGIATSVPSGSIQIATVLVPSGNATVATGNISNIAGSTASPFWPTIPQLATRDSNLLVISSSTTFTVPAGISRIRVRMVGGGGGGGGTGTVNTGGGSGGGGGYAESILSVIPGQVYNVTIGAAGVGTAGSGTAGGTSSFSGNGITAISATGGAAGSANSLTPAGGSGGSASGGTLLIAGQAGSDGGTTIGTGGPGGSSGGIAGGGGRAGSVSGLPGQGAGGGGGGGYLVSGATQASATGANGAAGVVIITY